MGKKIIGLFKNGFVIFLLIAAGMLLFFWVSLAQPSFRSAPLSQAQVSSEDLERHVRMLAEEFSPRSAAHIGNMNRTADYIKSEFENIGAGQVFEQWFEAGSYRYRNVSLLLGDPEAPRIIIGAHYDGYGPFQAADDNATGVSGMIELADLIGRESIQSPIEFVAYPLEEPPYFGTRKMGSWKHVDQLKKNGVTCRYMISLEMIGYFSDKKGSQIYPSSLLNLFYPDKGNFITVVGNTRNRKLTKRFKVRMKGTTDLPVYSICGPASIPGIDFSDHRNYWHAGMPALMITDTAFYRNRAYHTANDTVDRLDFERMAKVVIGVYEAVRQDLN